MAPGCMRHERELHGGVGGRGPVPLPMEERDNAFSFFCSRTVKARVLRADDERRSSAARNKRFVVDSFPGRQDQGRAHYDATGAAAASSRRGGAVSHRQRDGASAPPIASTPSRPRAAAGGRAPGPTRPLAGLAARGDTPDAARAASRRRSAAGAFAAAAAPHAPGEAVAIRGGARVTRPSRRPHRRCGRRGPRCRDESGHRRPRRSRSQSQGRTGKTTTASARRRPGLKGHRLCRHD